MSHTILNLINISKSYGNKKILSNINLKINEGEFVILFGESGIGKSTLLNIIALIDKPTSGEYFFDDEKINFNSEKQMSLFRNTKLGIVFQMYYLIPKLTVKENILSPFLYRKDFKSNIDNDLEKLLSALNLTDKKDQIVDSLSGGEKQRTAIARALIINPSVIVCDEPTGNLDEVNTKMIMEILKQITYEKRTIIMVSHNRALKRYATSAYEMTKEGLNLL